MHASETEDGPAVGFSERHRDGRPAGGGSGVEYSPVANGDGGGGNSGGGEGGLQKDVSEQVVLGAVFNILSTLFGMVMGVCAKLAGQHGIPVMELVLARSSTLMIAALAAICVSRQNPRGNRRGLLLIRGLCGFTGISLWYSALLLLPLADVIVFGFLTPLIVALLSPLLVNENPSRMVLAMTPVCIAGVVLCLRPPFLFGGEQRLDSLGVAFALGQAFVASLVKLSVRELRTSDSSNVIIFYLGWISTAAATAACVLIPGQWVTPTTLPQVGLLFGTGASAYAFQVCMTMGLRRVRAAPAAAIAYLSVVWGAAASIFIFHEVPTVLSVVGAVIICVGTMAVVLSEGWQQKRAQAAGSGPPTSGTSADGEWSDEESRLLDMELAAGKFGSRGGQEERGGGEAVANGTKL